MPTQLLTLRQAAEHLTVSLDTMRHLKGREIPFLYGIDRQPMFKVTDLDDYKKSKAYTTLPHRRRQSPGSPEPEMHDPWSRPNGKPILVEESIAAGKAPQPDAPVPPKQIKLEAPALTGSQAGTYTYGPATQPPDLIGTKTQPILAPNSIPTSFYSSRPKPEETIIHTDNPEVVQWLKARGITGTVKVGTLMVEDVRGKHLIAGQVPNYVQAAARTVTVIRARGVYIRGATAQDLDEAEARLVTYTPPTETTSIWE